MQVGQVCNYGYYYFLPILSLDIDERLACPIKQEGQGFANERRGYFARANPPLPFCATYNSKLLIPPELLSQYFYSFPYPVEMTDDVHILTGFGEFSKCIDEPPAHHKMNHLGVDFLCKEGTLVKSIDDGLVIGAREDPRHSYDGLADVYIYNPHNKLICGYTHLNTSSIPKAWFEIDLAKPETLLPISQGEKIGVVGKFPGEIHRDIYLEPDVEAKHGRNFNHLHLSCRYFYGDITNTTFEGNLFLILDESLSLNPLLFLQRLYE